jgi:hypothetical protein
VNPFSSLLQGILKLMSDKDFEPPSSLRSPRKSGISAGFVFLAVRFVKTQEARPDFEKALFFIGL